jgi:AcrR family transcriptional regulator
MTRQKIVNAFSALIQNDCLSPTAEQVAERAQVGMRTVFRHFDDMETLYREITHDLNAILQPALQQTFKSKNWRDRIDESIEIRAQLFDQVATFHLAAQIHRHESPYLREQLSQSAQLQRDLLQRSLPAAIVRQPKVFAALELVLSIDTWLRLRREQGLSTQEAIQVLRQMTAALIGNATPNPLEAS